MDKRRDRIAERVVKDKSGEVRKRVENAYSTAFNKFFGTTTNGNRVSEELRSELEGINRRIDELAGARLAAA